MRFTIWKLLFGVTKYLSSERQFRAPVNDFSAITPLDIFIADRSNNTFRDEHSVFQFIQSIDNLRPSSMNRDGLPIFLEKVEHEFGSDLEQRSLKYFLGKSGNVDSFDFPLQTFIVLHSLVEPYPLTFFARFHHLTQLKSEVVRCM